MKQPLLPLVFLLFCSFSIYSQIFVRPGVEDLVSTLNVTDYIYSERQNHDLKPILMILNTEVVNVNPEFKRDFNRYLKANNKLYHYRYLHDLCEYSTVQTSAQALERTTLVFHEELHTGNLISSMLEKSLQLKLEKFFAASVCFAYRLNRTQEYPMAKMAEDFSADWVISPVMVKVDTSNEGLRCVLQLEVWDAELDTLRFVKAFEQKGSTLEEVMQDVVAKASGFVASKLLMDKAFREIAKTSFERGKYFEELLASQNNKWLNDFLVKRGLEEGFIGGLVKKDKSRFMAFKMMPYTPDFEEELSLKNYHQRYDNVDVSEDMDPDRARFEALTLAGIKFEEEWIFMIIKRDWIYTPDSIEAQRAFYARCANLGIFEADTVKLYDNFWFEGFFTPLDTAEMVYKFDTAKAKNWRVNFAIDKFNAAPYKGLPEIFIHGMLSTYFSRSSDWYKDIAEQHLKRIFFDLEDRKVRDINFIDTERNIFPMIHDYRKTQGLLVIWVDELWGKQSLRFFYWNEEHSDELYEWTYFPKIMYDFHSGKNTLQYVTETLNKVTPWNASRAFVDDEKFWQEKVLAKEGEEYKYLVKVSAE